jgi:3-phenylpropionate/trans-cinnamate dioxygenase ferredoxin reductase component
LETRYDYLIIGGGMTAAAAAQGVREVDPKGTIGIISAEDQRPYNRPPLTKKLWQGKSEDIIWRDLPKEHLDLILGCRVSTLDPLLKQLQDQTGRSYGYKKLLLATGGSPRRLPFAPEDTLYYRTLEDYHTVRGWTGKGARIGIIGGGFIGSEIAAALASIGEQVMMVFPENGIGSRIYPDDLTQFITQYYQQKGVEVYPGMEIQAIDRRDNKFVMRAKDGRTVEVDHIIAGIGIRPNIELAEAAGISIGGPENGGGILVDGNLRTNQPEIYAAGDVASFFNPVLQQQMRVEHEDNANSMGRVAGLNMAGRETAYQHQPFFYSDLFDLGFEAVGELNPRLETYADWKEPFRQGVVYYLKNRKIRGVLLWNTWDQVDAARELISNGRAYADSELKGCLPKP